MTATGRKQTAPNRDGLTSLLWSLLSIVLRRTDSELSAFLGFFLLATSHGHFSVCRTGFLFLQGGLHQAIPVPKHTCDCISFSTAHIQSKKKKIATRLPIGDRFRRAKILQYGGHKSNPNSPLWQLFLDLEFPPGREGGGTRIIFGFGFGVGVT